MLRQPTTDIIFTEFRAILKKTDLEASSTTYLQCKYQYNEMINKNIIGINDIPLQSKVDSKLLFVTVKYNIYNCFVFVDKLDTIIKTLSKLTVEVEEMKRELQG